MRNILILITLTALMSCSKQAWYSSNQNTLTNECMKGPLSEYDDCSQQSSKSYNEYVKQREILLEDKRVSK